MVPPFHTFIFILNNYTSASSYVNKQELETIALHFGACKYMNVSLVHRKIIGTLIFVQRSSNEGFLGT